MPASADWFRSQAWSVISLAGNLRKQTRLERALRLATIAKRSFDSLEDEYGQAQCLFMFGFCLRLLGEFREASACLDHAYRLAEDNCFERARADTLMQIGEVRRCLGDLDEAREFLNEALERADGMRLLVTQAFAQSTLGAVEFQKQEYAEAYGYPVIERLKELLSSRGQCQILELDPWVPQLLNRFAQDAGDAGLVAQSETVLREAREILAERGTEGVERIAEVVDDIELEDEDEIDPRSAEMGGETRRDPSAFEEPGLLGEGLGAAGLHAVAA